MKYRFIILLFISSFCYSQPGSWYWSQLYNTVSGGGGGCTRVGIKFYSNFENNAQPWDTTNQVCCAYSAHTTFEQAKLGLRSMRIELRRNDPLVSSSSRAEIVQDGTNNPNDESWFGWSIFIPSDWIVDVTPEGIIQWHQSPNVSGVEPIGIWIDGNLFEVVVTKGLNQGNTYLPMTAVNVGQWNNIVIHIKWDSGTNGFIQCWVNNVQYVNYTGVTNYPGQGYYIKMGCYKWFWQDPTTPSNVTKRVYFYDEFRQGDVTSNYCSVYPG